MELIYRGAEAELWKDSFMGIPVVRKIRVPKAYLHRELEERIRSNRMRTEVRMLIKARGFVNTPHVLNMDDKKNEITLEYIKGDKVRDILYSGEKLGELGELMGTTVKELHNGGIIHNDLTTSNFIFDGEKLWIIDFGLAESSNRLEDKATDIVVFKRMLNATHWDVFDDVWNAFKYGYDMDSKMEYKIREIENRAKYMR